MNSFGRIFRVSIFGGSHGESVGILIDGCTCGPPLTVGRLATDLESAKEGNKKEPLPARKLIILFSRVGLFNEKTTGAPLLYSLKITIREVPTMKSNEAFHVRAMQIW